jgi:tetratricopeptide (TPR) repeat protein
MPIAMTTNSFASAATAEPVVGAEPTTGERGGPTARRGLGAALHLGIAEQGKLAALSGDHGEALVHYRAAMQLCSEQKSAEVFYRHYTECALESLELMGAFDDVLAYCNKALEHYLKNPPQTEVARSDFAHVYQRQGVCLLKLGQASAAKEALQSALAVSVNSVSPARVEGAVPVKGAARVGSAAPSLPLVVSLLGWLRTGLHCDVARVVQEQRRHNYFSVRRETLQPTRAIQLPQALRQTVTQRSSQSAPVSPRIKKGLARAR